MFGIDVAEFFQVAYRSFDCDFTNAKVIGKPR